MEIKCLYDKLQKITSLKPHPKNRNRHPKEQIERLAKILAYQGWRYPIKVSKRSGFITTGHGRVEAARKNGWTKVPVNYQDYASEEQEYADVQADNAIASWSELSLAEINEDLKELDGQNFDLDMLGIKDFELEPSDKYGDKDADDAPEVRATDIVLGELFFLGTHRLLCGDSTDATHVSRLMNDEKADMVFTDPPYGLSIQTDYGNRMKGSKRAWASGRALKVYNPIAGDDKDFDPSNILTRFSDSKIFLWGANNYTEKLDKGQWFVWYKKTTEQMKKMFGWDFELCWTNQKAGQVYEQSWAGCLGHNKKLDGETKTHPSMKSVKLIIRIFEDYEANLVVDPYLGSGSTLIACEKTNRKCYGMEIDPQYCQVIIDRWEKFTGQKAVKELANPKTTKTKPKSPKS